MEAAGNVRPERGMGTSDAASAANDWHGPDATTKVYRHVARDGTVRKRGTGIASRGAWRAEGLPGGATALAPLPWRPPPQSVPPVFAGYFTAFISILAFTAAFRSTSSAVSNCAR